ncbi:MAG: hypothetical protein MI784_06555 [Cytophagales bacterium]|nr:hypothetical protein [Cytophagales bacterium]
MITLLDERYAGIVYNPDLKCVWITYKGYASSEEYRNTINVVLNGVKKYRAPVTVSDARDQAIVNNNDIQYTASKAEEMNQAGVNHHIIIQPESFFTQQSVKNFSGKMETVGDYTVHNVSSEEEVKAIIKKIQG